MRVLTRPVDRSIDRSIAFIVSKPVKRENKGVHFGIQRVNRFIRQCSHNYHSDAYCLKLDIKGFFMHIDKRILWNRLTVFIDTYYVAVDKNVLLMLCEKVIFNEAASNCIIKGCSTDWEGLPANKSLFHSAQYCGLPIGNLTSQIFANFYMNNFDHFMKHTLGLRYYGRYVDDFIVVHAEQDFLSSINSYLGMMQHCATYRLRKKMLWRYIDYRWWEYCYACG